jgi:signal transduction histidine kinase
MTLRSKSQQNLVWAGMAKETAHQMGTPLTSLHGWVEMLKESGSHQQIVEELEKDVSRLKLVSDRFGKIGSQPQLEQTDLAALVLDMVAYMRRRAPGRVVVETHGTEHPAHAMASPTLLNWVLENLLKNALDALEGKGKILVAIQENPANVIIDVTDSGKGISPENLRKVFAPGFTTKKRGWGLGLTLSKRIMEQYHKGELYVKHSEPGKGTTFRMVVRKH